MALMKLHEAKENAEMLAERLAYKRDVYVLEVKPHPLAGWKGKMYLVSTKPDGECDIVGIVSKDDFRYHDWEDYLEMQVFPREEIER